jgi:hypothetical protein
MKTLKILALIAIISTLSIAQKEALLIGVGDYQGKKNDLKGIEIDVSNMKTLFEKWGFHTTVLLNSDSMKIDEYLTNYHYLGADDSFAFYYSGHGSQTEDESGDEIKDKKDETLVLSNGIENRFYLDDNLNKHFNSIGAKKLIVFDSCHSGTAFKAFGDKPKPKSISSKLSGTEIKSKAFRHRVSEELNSGEYIVFSASQDREESLATRDGSLFTNAFVKEFKSGGDSKKLANIKQSIEQDIYKYCKETDSVVHHPNLSASKDKLKYTTINKFFATKATPPPPQKTITISGETTFKEGELLSFKIDTNGNRGYLTIFSIEDGKPFIMTQTSQAVSGVLDFQRDFSIKPPIECYKSCGSCKQEVSSVYVILSEKPLTQNIMETKGLNIKRDSSVGMRAFRHKTDDSFEPIIVRVEFTII